MAALQQPRNSDQPLWRTVMMSGYVEKESLFLKRFRRRWFILSGDGVLRSYKSSNIEPANDQPTERIPLSKFKFVCAKESETASRFQLISSDKKRCRRFKAENAWQWVTAIRTADNRDIVAIKIKLQIRIRDTLKKDSLVVSVLRGTKMRSIFDRVLQYAEREHLPFKLLPFKFVILSMRNSSDQLLDADDLFPEFEQRALTGSLEMKYEHKVGNATITCSYMNRQQSQDPLQCPIYSAMKQRQQYTRENLRHLTDFEHFANEYEEKPRCKYGDECKAYVRQEQGTGGNRLDEQCHMKLYRHPPRTRNIKLATNMHKLVVKTRTEQCHPLYKVPPSEWNTYHRENGFLSQLISEVVRNGYKSDLCLECGADDDCKHNGNSIMKIVDEKMRHTRHKLIDSPLTRDQMLALVLYTGGECNYDLCASQRNGNYEKWKWLDYCLWKAIQRLSEKETGSFPVFSGLNAVKLDKKSMQRGYFVTYVSTSWNKDVASTFIRDGEGMIIQFDAEYRKKEHAMCCDVSWISRFPDECEILYAYAPPCTSTE